MSNKLEDFLMKYYKDDPSELIDVIKRTKIRCLTTALQSKYDMEFYMGSMIMKSRQKKLYDVHEQETKELIHFAKENELKVVFLKGLYLAAELYEDIDNRLSSDIDILVQIEEFPKIDQFLVSKGYTCSPRDRKVILNDYVSRLKIDHIGYTKKVNDYIVTIEVHGAIINSGGSFKDLTEEFIQNSFEKRLLNSDPYILKLEYNIVFLIIHFIKHLPFSYLENVILGKKTTISLTNLNDIALLIEKYTVDWDKVLVISKRMEVVRYVHFTLVLINKVYGNLTDDSVILKFKENISLTSMNGVLAVRYGLGIFWWFFDAAINKINELDIIEFLGHTLVSNIDLRKIAVDDFNKLMYVKDSNQCNVAFTIEDCKLSDLPVGVSLNVLFTEQGIKISYVVTNKACSAYMGEDDLYKKDGAELLLITRSKIIQRMFTLAYNGKDYYIIQSSHNTEKYSEEIPFEKENYEIQITDNSFSCACFISWDALEIDIHKDTILPLNAAYLLSDPTTKTRYKSYNLYNNDRDFFDFRGIGGIRFE